MKFYSYIRKDDIKLIEECYYLDDNNLIDKNIINEILENDDDFYLDIEFEDYYNITHSLYRRHLVDEKFNEIYIRFATNHYINKKKLSK